MFKKLISSLIIISMLVSDLSGWGNRSASAMMEPDEQRQIIAIQLRDGPDETLLQGKSLEDINGSKFQVDSDRESAATGSEKDHGNDRQLILDLGQGISLSKGNGETLNLSPSNPTTVASPLFSPREGIENDMTKGNASSAQSSGEIETTSLPDYQVPEQKKETLVLNRVEKKVQEDAKLQHTLPSIKEFDEKTPLLQPKKRLVLFSEESQEKKMEKKDNLTKDWELAGGESDEELILKQKNDGIHMDQSDGPSFEGDIRGTRSETQQEPKENLFYKNSKTEASLRALLSESDDLEYSSDRGIGYSGMENSPLPESQRSGVELTKFQTQSFLSDTFNPFSMKTGKPTSEKKRPSFPYEGHRGSLEKRSSYPSQGLNINGGGGSELGNFSEYEGSGFEDFTVDSVNPSRNLFAEEQDLIIPLEQIRNLSPEVEDFLRHVKVRIIDGKLNWKQWLGIGGGIVIGAGCAWPWMVIMFDSLLDMYANSIAAYYIGNNLNVDPAELTKQFQILNLHLNFKNMVTLTGIPIGISVASKTASILVDLTKDRIDNFSRQKNPKHIYALYAAKGCAYLGASFAGLLPIYYLFHSLLGCDLTANFMLQLKPNEIDYQYYISNDIFLNISTNYIKNPDLPICTFQSLPNENFKLFGIGSIFLFLNTFLCYGHQVSNALENCVNHYFSSKKEDISHFTFNSMRQKYLAQFTNLIRIMERGDLDELSSLYNSIFLNNLRKVKQRIEINTEEPRSFQSLHILKVFQNFFHQLKDGLEEETADEWRKAWASRIGWAIPLIATFGRMVIFQYVIAEFLGTFWRKPDAFYYFYIDFIQPSPGATIISCIFGYTLAHLAQGFVEKEAVEECVYEILGGQKLTQGTSHAPLRVSLKIWNYLYGVFQTLPYLVIGFAATTNYNPAIISNFWPNLYQTSYPYPAPVFFPFNVGQILFLLSFGTADVFNNIATSHQSSSILVNAFDSLISNFYVFEGYKRDKLVYVTHQLQQIFKEITPEVLQQIHHTLNEDDENSAEPLRKKDTPQKNMIGATKKVNVSSLISGDQTVAEVLLETKDNAEARLCSLRNISFETQEFLEYINSQVVQGSLNWQQKAGIIGGVTTGLAVSWPLMAIIFYGLLTPYFQTFNPRTSPGSNSIFSGSPAIITEGLTQFNKGANIYTLAAFIGLPLGIDAASRTAIILRNMAADKTSSFSIHKTKNHFLLLLGAKSALYFCTFFASILPVYYLYDSFFGSFENPCPGSDHACSKMEGWFPCPSGPNQIPNCPNGTPYCPAGELGFVYTYSVSTDIFFNINETINSNKFCNHATDISHKVVFGIGAPFLFFDTFLQYGYQISTSAEGWIDDYFLGKMRAFSHLFPTEAMRKKYLNKFKGLKRTIYNLEEEKVNNLYADIFSNDKNSVDLNTELNSEKLTINEALHILTVFENFHRQHQKYFKPKEEGSWKKTWSSHIGWIISLVATFGRMLIFQYILEEALDSTADSLGMSISSIAVTILSCILGGIFANIAQGWMEKDAVEKGVYDLLRGDKIPDGSSHPALRKGIKTWDYLYGIFNTLPYLTVGLEASGYTIAAGEPISPWQVLLLIFFGIADAFNNAVAFHESNLGVVNAYDSLVTSYGTPSTEQKKDRLIRMTRQLRRLFKDLHPDVLVEVDRELNKNSKNVQRGDYEDDFEQGEDEYSKYKEKVDI